MNSGNESQELTEAGTWETFPQFAEKFTKQIGAKVLERVEGADIHSWKIEYDGVVLNFVYDDYPNGVSIEPVDSRGKSAIDKLFEVVMDEASEDGF